MREKSQYLFLENPLVINVTLAKALGLNESIIIQQFSYWLDNNEKSNKNFHDGYYWTYNSYSKWVSNFPFWSESTIKRTILRLEKNGILISANYNTMPIDKTKWYRIDDNRLNESVSIGLLEYKIKEKKKTKNKLSIDQIVQPSGQNDPTRRSKRPNQKGKLTQPYQRLTTETNIKSDEKSSLYLTSKIKEIVEKYYIDINGQKLSWEGKGGQYGKEIKRIVKQAAEGAKFLGKEKDENVMLNIILAKAKSLYLEIGKDSESWIAKQGFTYTTLTSRWNNLKGVTVVKEPDPPYVWPTNEITEPYVIEVDS